MFDLAIKPVLNNQRKNSLIFAICDSSDYERVHSGLDRLGIIPVAAQWCNEGLEVEFMTEQEAIMASMLGQRVTH